MASSPLSDYLKEVQPALTCAAEVVACCSNVCFLNSGCVLTALSEEEDEKELAKNVLPGRWNSNKSVYTFIYRYKGKRVLTKVLPLGDQVIVSSVIEGNPQTPNVTLNCDDYVNVDSLSDFSSCLKNENTLLSTLTKQLSEPLKITLKKETNLSNPLIVNPNHGRYNPQRPGRRQDPRREPRFPGDFGGDIGPFGSNPGSLMGPNHGIFQPGRTNARGRYDPLRPPGSRYDPVGPNGLPRNPNSDHFRMPRPGGPRGRGNGNPRGGPPGNMFF